MLFSSACSSMGTVGVLLAVMSLCSSAAAWIAPGAPAIAPASRFRASISDVSAATRRGLAVSIFVLPPAQMDAQSLAENALFTVTTAFALSRLFTIATAKLADALNPEVKLPDAEWDRLVREGRLTPQVFNGACLFVHAVGRTMARMILTTWTGIRRPAALKDRASILVGAQRREEERHLRLRCLRDPTVQFNDQIRLRKRLAVVF
jgi:hypothetical protein